MTELITWQVKFITSMIMVVFSWVFAQASTFEPFISQGFDQLISLGFAAVAVTVLWKALNQRNKEMAEFKREIIDDLREQLKNQNESN